ncbi:MAG: DUF4097 family beta strand repeat-containing protein [Gemmatimonadales bacterium]
MRYGILGIATLAGALALAAPLRAQNDDHWSWHGTVAAGKTVEIRDINGSVTADAASGSEVEVTAVKRAGRHGDPKDVRIVEEEGDGGVTICVVYPGRSVADGCAQRGQRRHYDDEDNRNDTEVEFTVHVPPGVEFSGNTVNGDVLARGMSSRVSGHSVNGGVEIETSAGDASGESVNGSVHAVVRGQGQEPLRFSSVNGAVDVTLPRAVNADLDASTVNGSIESDFEITIQGGMSMRRSRLHGRIGQGGRALRVSTVNGSIRLRAAT